MFRLLAISNRATLPVSPPDWLRALAAAGIGAVQIREKDLDDRSLFGLAQLARAALPPRTRLVVNGRLDIALAAGANGVHLPGDGLPVAALRERFGPEVLLGRSTHRVEEVERARDEGADYVTFGPVYATPGKGEPVELGELARAAAVGLPVYALGGVTLDRFGELASAGASGVAAIRMFQQIDDLSEVARAARAFFGRDNQIEAD